MRLIDADRLLGILEREQEQIKDIPTRVDGIIDAIMDVLSAPTVDAVEVVRCRDCRYWKKDHVLDGYTLFEGHMVCTYAIAHSFVRHPEDFCSAGERKERDGDENH